MNLHQFRFVREAVRQKFNLTEAAKALYTSQPGVSKAIIELEEELGVDIFTRHGKRIRGLTEPGRPSPYRDRTVADNLARFRAMRAGELPDGACVLRAKIDLAAANMKMRDPLLYRIRHAHHHRTGDAWCIYPMYDYAHPLSDAFEGITHSICTLEFENNRELYDWVVAATDVQPLPRLARRPLGLLRRLDLCLPRRPLPLLVPRHQAKLSGRRGGGHRVVPRLTTVQR